MNCKAFGTSFLYWVDFTKTIFKGFFPSLWKGYKKALYYIRYPLLYKNRYHQNPEIIYLVFIPMFFSLSLFKSLDLIQNSKIQSTYMATIKVSWRIRTISQDESLWLKINLCEKFVPCGFIQKILNHGCKYLGLYRWLIFALHKIITS